MATATYGWTKDGAVKIVKDDVARILVMRPGNIKGQWISKTHLSTVPTTLRLVKNANFDQDCGCTAVIDVNGNKVETYNVYGSMRKYSKAEGVKAADASAHHRRKNLSDGTGYTRAKGRVLTIGDVAAFIYDKVSEARKDKKGKVTREGYRVLVNA
jgi:hypothetical protein